MVNELDRWLLEVDFEYSNFLSPYIDNILKEYNNIQEQEQNESFDIILNIKDINNYLLPKLKKTIQKYFFIDEEYETSECNVYVQPPEYKQTTPSFLHNHAHSPGNICGVFYLNIPKEGGEFWINNPPYIDLKIKPKLDKLYLFPIWLNHAALPHKDDIYRISFNWMYGGIQRPVYKFKGNFW